MEFENTIVYNMFEAIQAMRLSHNSKSDTICTYRGYVPQQLFVGPRDEKLIKELVSKGPSHRKFMRQILMSVDITAPRYWWTQFDTYKVGVTTCSESTMHTIMKKPIVQEDFAETVPIDYIKHLEVLRQCEFFDHLVNCLPQGYLQKRHVTMNYEVVRNIREQRAGHKLSEWKEFIEWADSLPHADLFFGGNE